MTGNQVAVDGPGVNFLTNFTESEKTAEAKSMTGYTQNFLLPLIWEKSILTSLTIIHVSLYLKDLWVSNYQHELKCKI